MDDPDRRRPRGPSPFPFLDVPVVGLAAVLLVVIAGAVGWLVLDKNREAEARAAYEEYRAVCVEVDKAGAAAVRNRLDVGSIDRDLRDDEHAKQFPNRFNTPLPEERLAELRKERAALEAACPPLSARFEDATARAKRVREEWRPRWVRLGITPQPIPLELP